MPLLFVDSVELNAPTYLFAAMLIIFLRVARSSANSDTDSAVEDITINTRFHTVLVTIRVTKRD